MSYMSCPRCWRTIHESDFVHRSCSYCRSQHPETDGHKVVVEFVNNSGDTVEEVVVTLTDEQAQKCMEVGLSKMLKSYIENL